MSSNICIDGVSSESVEFEIKLFAGDNTSPVDEDGFIFCDGKVFTTKEIDNTLLLHITPLYIRQ